MTVRATTAPALAVLAALALGACGAASRSPAARGADPGRGHELIVTYGCGACHRIGGVEGADARVGPRLTAFAKGRYLLGRIPRTPASTADFIVNPQREAPNGAMPGLGVSPQQARDIAAYLYSQ